MSDNMGPWIEHDGARPEPWAPPGAISCIIQVLRSPNSMVTASDKINQSDPGFYWRWKRVKTGWLSWGMRRVCDDPAYAPIIRFQFRFGEKASSAVERLAEIVADPSRQITAPEGPARGPGKVKA